MVESDKMFKGGNKSKPSFDQTVRYDRVSQPVSTNEDIKIAPKNHSPHDVSRAAPNANEHSIETKILPGKQKNIPH